jgi:hypothetical protein
MNRIMPVVVVIGRESVPTAVMRLQRVVCPTLTSICAANRNSLASEPQRPHIRCMGIIDAWFNRQRSRSKRRRLTDNIWLREKYF